MLGQLLPCSGGAAIPLLKESLLLGRKPGCDIPIACSSVSGQHCQLEYRDGAWWVRDLGSKNGTAVNGRRVTMHRIAPLDILSVGRQRLVVDYQSAVQNRRKAVDRQTEDDLAMALLNSLADEGPEAAEPAPVNVSPARIPIETRGLTRDGVAKQPTDNPDNLLPKFSDLGRLVPAGGGPPIVLTATELIVGRGRECDVRIRAPSVSSRHCKLHFVDGYWHVEDLNSTNGTWVDGERCLYECLMPDSVLALDKHRFTIQYVPQSDSPPPAVRRLFTQSLLEKAGLADELHGNQFGGEQLPEDELDRPRRYNLLDSDDGSL